MDFEELALEYHAKKPRGKIETKLTKKISTQEELSLAYSPGVAGPCRKIHENKLDAFQYTGKGNLVGVVTNGSAVLGLGKIGPDAAKPVMEGKAMLFKKFANIDVFDIEVDADDPDLFISIVKSLEPTFGGINLEDIKAPECFYIEQKLQEQMSIPVFHDDQHGTAIIASAAFINALEIAKKEIQNVKVVISGAGSAAIACGKLFKELGVSPRNMVMCDSKGVLYKGRKERMNPFKEEFAIETSLRTLSDAIDNADVFLGVSQKDILTEEMILKMAPHPIVFALANPDPEINPNLARKARPDAIIATGRSDFPNQVNNVLGFPFIFRGALDCQATCINEPMKKAAVLAIASLAKEHVPEEVLNAYNTEEMYTFGKNYLIPKPVDPRVLLRIAPAVAKAAMESGVARKIINLDQYHDKIEQILGTSKKVMRKIRNNIVKCNHKYNAKPKIVLSHGYDSRAIKAANEVAGNGEVSIAVLGNRESILREATEIGIVNFDKKIEIIDPLTDTRINQFADKLYKLGERKGLTRRIALELLRRNNYFAAMLVNEDYCQGMVTGLLEPYMECLTPIKEIIDIGTNETLCGVQVLAHEQKLYFFADCSVNVDPTSEELAEIAISTANLARKYGEEEVRVAFLSFSSFGSRSHPQSDKMAKAAEILKSRNLDIISDGEIQADAALDPEIQGKEFPFARLKGAANVLIFPDLASANISYKLLGKFTEIENSSPILVGPKKPAHILGRSAGVSEIVNIIYVAAIHSYQIKRI